MNKKIKRFKVRYIVFGLLVLLIVVTLIFMHFGGFSTGESANPEEFKKYAKSLDSIRVPEKSKIIALGEATHGNIEFQQLKLDIFKQMVEKYNVKAFVLEGDYGGCEQVNRYIHGGEGSSQEVASAIGFDIYRTDEMADIIFYMRKYNEKAPEGEDLRFYGFDMQRTSYNFQFLNEYCKELGVDTTILQKLMYEEGWNSEYDYNARIQIIKQIKDKLKSKENSFKAIHFADMLLQYFELQTLTNSEGSELRDKFMAENVQWILQQEKELGYERIFVSGHNNHVAKWGSFDSMGKLLSKKIENEYYVIGTDFYRTECNMPVRSSTKRTDQVFYSHNPLAKTSKMAGLDISWVNFEDIPKDSELGELISQYTYMGNLGEGYSWFMRLLPPSYRIFQPPAVLYDSMIFVADARPTKIVTK